jgi:predicted methyltransferase
VAEGANSGYRTPEGRERVAHSLVRPGRDATQLPEELVRHLHLKPGMTVADIGTGAGYMLPYLSKAVGPGGMVLAEDIFDDFLGRARERAHSEGLANVKFIKGTEKTPNLPPSSVDVALALDSYHHYDYPQEMLAGILAGLKPGGRLVIVDFYRRPDAMPRGNAMEHIRADEAEVIREVEEAGFRFVSRREHIKGSQYMATFVKQVQ